MPEPKYYETKTFENINEFHDSILEELLTLEEERHKERKEELHKQFINQTYLKEIKEEEEASKKFVELFKIQEYPN